MNRRMPNGTYGGVRGKGAKAKTLAPRPTRFSFGRMSKYNLIRGEAFISGECVSVIEDSGFTNVEQVIAKVLMSMHDDVPRPTKVQIKITNLDKRQIQLYQRILQ